MKKILLSVFALMIVLPSIAFASWWNPLTWFQKTTPVIQPTTTVQVVIPTQTKNSQVSSNQTSQKSTNDESVIQKIVPASNKVTPNVSANTPAPDTTQSQQIVINLPVGCTSILGFSTTTGVRCNSTTPVQQQISEIQGLLSQIANTTPVTPTAPPAPTDVCSNINGVQTTVPTGMQLLTSGSCVPLPATISVNETKDICIAKNSNYSGGSSYLTCTISYSVTATNGSINIPATIAFVAEFNGSHGINPGTTASITSVVQNGTNAISSQSNTGWIINSGVTANFTATVIINDVTSANPGLYRAYLTNVPWSAVDGQSTANTYYPEINSSADSGFVYVN